MASKLKRLLRIGYYISSVVTTLKLIKRGVDKLRGDGGNSSDN